MRWWLGARQRHGWNRLGLGGGGVTGLWMRRKCGEAAMGKGVWGVIMAQ